MVKFFNYTSKGMTLLELSASIVVVSIIALGMTSGAQAVMLHYQADTVRQDLRQYGNNVMREITRELNLAQKIEIDGQNGFSRIKLYEKFTDISPDLKLTFHNSGHILGSAGAHFHVGDGLYNLVFSGDIKFENTWL